MRTAAAWACVGLASCVLLACTASPRRSASPQGVRSVAGSTLAPRAIGPDIFSGPLPLSVRDLEALRARGIITLIHVDALRPDVPRALAAGLDTRHIPIRLAGATREQSLALARAVRTARRRGEGVYFTSRDARVRAPTAAALAAIVLGDRTPAQGLDYLSVCGVELDARGMHRSVRDAMPAGAGELDNLAPNASEPGPEPTFAEAMASAQANLDVLVELDDRGVVASSPGSTFSELDVARDLRGSVATAHTLMPPAAGEDFARLLLESLVQAQDLEERATGRARPHDPRMHLDPREAMRRALRDVQATCHACHAQFRDR